MSEWLEKESELEREQALDGGSAAISIALDGAKGDPALRAHIGGFLVDQRGLIADQRHHVREQLKTPGMTPRWGRLKWGDALSKQGEAAEAKAQFTAAGLDLMAAERAELAAQKA